MAQLLRQLGIVMNETELRVLVDAFDANGDGRVTMSEFLEFAGPKRDRKGGASLSLSQRCCWETTCRRTGMANAYTICPVKGEVADMWSRIDESRRGESKEESLKSDLRAVYRSSEVVTLKSGEKRLRLESAERHRRDLFLCRTGLLAEEGKEEYADDYEEADESEAVPPKKKEGCEHAGWAADGRREGLRYLADLTRVARQESALKELIASGSPPRAPRVFCGLLGDPDVGEAQEEELLTDAVLLRWEAHRDDLVSFFSGAYPLPLVDLR